MPENDGNFAHHIVASTHKEAEEARRALVKYQIDINDAVNGVSLSFEEHYKRGLHSDKVIGMVNTRIRDAIRGINDWGKARNELLDELAKLKIEIKNGRFP